MYTPKSFNETRVEVLHDLMRRYSFATLVCDSPDGLVATHLPFLFDDARGPHGTLRAHMARANSQWRALSSDKEALVIFQGPHTYISPSWYTSKEVPTWNYAAVHCYGKVRLIEEMAVVRAMLTQLVATYESAMPQPWKIEQLSENYIDQLCRAIVAFDIEITRIEGKWKFNQNRTQQDREGVMAALGASSDPLAHDVVQIMRALESEKKNGIRLR